jgi:hypothetical protein
MVMTQTESAALLLKRQQRVLQGQHTIHGDPADTQLAAARGQQPRVGAGSQQSIAGTAVLLAWTTTALPFALQ